MISSQITCECDFCPTKVVLNEPAPMGAGQTANFNLPSGWRAIQLAVGAKITLNKICCELHNDSDFGITTIAYVVPEATISVLEPASHLTPA